MNTIVLLSYAGSTFPMEQPSSVPNLGLHINSYSHSMEASYSKVYNSPAWHIHIAHGDVGGQPGEGAEGHHGGGQEAGHAFSST